MVQVEAEALGHCDNFLPRDKDIMEKLTFVPVMLPALLYCMAYVWCQEFLDPDRINHIEQIIRANQFYPPLRPNEDQLPKPLVFGLIMSFGGNIDSSGVVPGVRVALDQINNESSLLPGYTLHYALSDSQVAN